MKGERTVAGVRCGEVLAELSEFVDGRLSAGRAEELKAHVDGCDVCERFGADFAIAIAGLRTLGEAEPLEEGVLDRLSKALSKAI